MVRRQNARDPRLCLSPPPGLERRQLPCLDFPSARFGSVKFLICCTSPLSHRNILSTRKGIGRAEWSLVDPGHRSWLGLLGSSCESSQPVSNRAGVMRRPAAPPRLFHERHAVSPSHRSSHDVLLNAPAHRRGQPARLAAVNRPLSSISLVRGAVAGMPSSWSTPTSRGQPRTGCRTARSRFEARP